MGKVRTELKKPGLSINTMGSGTYRHRGGANSKMSSWPFIVVCLLTALNGIGPGGSLSAADKFEPVAGSLSADVRPLDAQGLPNLFALGTNVYSGGAPDGDAGFASLATLGVKTIITVDGATPDVETARKFGIRYVHLPTGYDGVSSDVQLLLAKAGRELEGPIYVHCHHGQHRGPTAAAVICMADLDWSREQAEVFLVAAGTSTNYPGLYETIRDFKQPSDEQLRLLPARFPEKARVSGLVDAMVQIDERWEQLKAVRAAGYQAPPDHPDVEPANETVILWEHFREAQRLPEAIQRGDNLITRLKDAESEAKEAERLLRLFAGRPGPETKEQLNKTFDALGGSCSACHQAYRNPAGMKSER